MCVRISGKRIEVRELEVDFYFQRPGGHDVIPNNDIA